MKKTLLAIIGFVTVFASCKKKENTVSMLVAASRPTISFTTPQYVGIGIGEDVPSFTATAYDSLYMEQSTPVINASTVDNQKEGAYVVNVSAKNKYGMAGIASGIVVVTTVNPLFDLSGDYERYVSGNPTGIVIHLDKLGRGVYRTDNAAGVTGELADFPAVFGQINDSTLEFPEQYTSDGASTIMGNGIQLDITSSADTFIQYYIGGTYSQFSQSSLRRFKKL